MNSLTDTGEQFAALANETHGYWKYMDMWLRRSKTPLLPHLELSIILDALKSKSSSKNTEKIDMPCHKWLILIMRTCAMRNEYLAAPTVDSKSLIKKRYRNEETWRVAYTAATVVETLVALCGAGILGLILGNYKDIVTQIKSNDAKLFNQPALSVQTRARVIRALSECVCDWSKEYTAGLSVYDDCLSLLFRGFCEGNVDAVTAGVEGYNTLRRKHVDTVRQCMSFNL